MIFYFSGTGNSKWVAEELAQKTNDNAIMITQAEDIYVLKENEALGFIFPVYAWDLPTIMEKFMASIKLENYHDNYTYFVATCHSQTGNMDAQVKKILGKRGMKCNAGFSINMPNNYLLAPFVKTDKIDKRTQLLQDAQNRIEEIASAVSSKKKIIKLKRGANFLSLFAPLFKKYMTAKGFWVENEKCIKCNKCAEICPVKNIKLSPYPVWGNDCEMCQACLNCCPAAAIQYGHYTRGKKRYLFSKTFLPKIESKQ